MVQQPSSFVYNQEIPDVEEAFKRARSSLDTGSSFSLSWEPQQRHQTDHSSSFSREDRCDGKKKDSAAETSRRPSTPSGFWRNGCPCRHIKEYLPLELELQFGLRQITNGNSPMGNNSSTTSSLPPSQQQYSLWLCNPIHALHMSSQGLCELTKSAAAQQAAAAAAAAAASGNSAKAKQKQKAPTVTQPMLYGDEQERSMAAQVSGLHELWHPSIQSFPPQPQQPRGDSDDELKKKKKKQKDALQRQRQQDPQATAAVTPESLSIKPAPNSTKQEVSKSNQSIISGTSSELQNDSSDVTKPITIGKDQSEKAKDAQVDSVARHTDSVELEALKSGQGLSTNPMQSGKGTVLNPKQEDREESPSNNEKNDEGKTSFEERAENQDATKASKGEEVIKTETVDSSEASGAKILLTEEGKITGGGMEQDAEASGICEEKEQGASASEQPPNHQKDSEKTDITDKGKADELSGTSSTKPDHGDVAESKSTKTEDNSKSNKKEVPEKVTSKEKGDHHHSLLDDSAFKLYHKREENVRAIRRALLGKRGPLATSAKLPPDPSQHHSLIAPVSVRSSVGSSPSQKTPSRDTSSSAIVSSGSVNANKGAKKKSSKKTASGSGQKSSSTNSSTPSHLTQLVSYEVPLVENKVTSSIAYLHQQYQERVFQQVEQWMTHYRLAVLTSTTMEVESFRTGKRKRNQQPVQVKKRMFGETLPTDGIKVNRQFDNTASAKWNKRFLFGEDNRETPDLHDREQNLNTSTLCPPCTTNTSGEIIMHCLHCGYVASKNRMRRHMVLEQHWLAVTGLKVSDASNTFEVSSSILQPRRQLYCFHCDEFYQHVVFLQEEERMAVQKLLPWMSWDTKSLKTHQRSFDPLRFTRIPGVGIFWTGFQATYPLNVPNHHIQASRICRLRRQLVEYPPSFCFEDSCSPPSPCVAFPLGTVPNNSRNRNLELMRDLVSVVKDKIRKPVGMYNLGHTCFQSAVFQCLIHCGALQTYFLHDVGHSMHACHIYRSYMTKRLQEETRSSMQRHMRNHDLPPVCLASEMDRMFLHYQSRSSGINVLKAMDDLADRVLRAPVATMDLLFNPLALLREADDGAVVERVARGEPLIEHKDLLAATWNCKQMAHLAGYDQRDAHEFLHAFLETLGQHTQQFRRMVSDSVNTKKKNMEGQKSSPETQTNVIQDIFEGTLRSVLRCQQCGEKRVKKESFLSISLDLSKEVQKTATTSAQVGPSLSLSSPSGIETRKLSVEKCLHHFTTPEELVDPVHCPLCAKKTTTTKQLVISHLPRVLCLHLKRFQGATGRKLEAFVSFPSDDLNLGPYLPQWCEDSGPYQTSSMVNDGHLEEQPPHVPYKLFATVNHYGNLQSGHYVSYVKVDDEWYHCNDSHISYTTESHVLQQGNAYLLFYLRDDKS